MTNFLQQLFQQDKQNSVPAQSIYQSGINPLNTYQDALQGILTRQAQERQQLHPFLNAIGGLGAGALQGYLMGGGGAGAAIKGLGGFGQGIKTTALQSKNIDDMAAQQIRQQQDEYYKWMPHVNANRAGHRWQQRIADGGNYGAQSASAGFQNLGLPEMNSNPAFGSGGNSMQQPAPVVPPAGQQTAGKTPMMMPMTPDGPMTFQATAQAAPTTPIPFDRGQTVAFPSESNYNPYDTSDASIESAGIGALQRAIKEGSDSHLAIRKLPSEIQQAKSIAEKNHQDAVKTFLEGKEVPDNAKSTRTLQASQVFENRKHGDLYGRTNPNIRSGSQPTIASMLYDAVKKGDITKDQLKKRLLDPGGSGEDIVGAILAAAALKGGASAPVTPAPTPVNPKGPAFSGKDVWAAVSRMFHQPSLVEQLDQLEQRKRTQK